MIQFLHFVYSRQPRLSGRAGLKVARDSVGMIDTLTFDRCVFDRRTQAKVDTAYLDGRVLGIDGTPSTLLQQRLIDGGVPYSEFRSLLLDELANRHR